MAEEIKYTVEREGTERNLRIEWTDLLSYPNLEYNPIAMEKVIDILIEVGAMTTITFETTKNYVYTMHETKMLNEIARVFIYLVKERKILVNEVLMGQRGQACVPGGYAQLKEIINLIKSDPVGAYVKAVRALRQAKANLKSLETKGCREFAEEFERLINEIVEQFKHTEMIKSVEDQLAGFKVGNREVYTKLFEPIIKPNFMHTRLVTEPPERGEQMDNYEVDESDVAIYSIPNQVRLLYHVVTPEYKLDEQEYTLLNDAREIMAKFKPKQKEFINPNRMRSVFYNISKDLVEELVQQKKLKFSYKKIHKLARILMRLTVGFGLIEELLQDKRLEDIYVNAPVGMTPIIVKHNTHGECETNIYPNITEAKAWSSRFRMLSGRALDEANPVLDTELETPKVRARVAIIQQPLSPNGLSFTFRRHRPKPWTLPLLMNVKSINPLAAGLYWFLIDGNRPMLVAGTRGAGKTSLLSSLLIEIMRKYRIITVEDTLELPVDYMRGLGYNMISMKVRSAIVGSESELSASDGIRTSLRLGDSCLIVGEVRSSLRGDQEVVIVDDGVTKRVAIKDLDGKSLKKVFVPTLTSDNHVELKKLTGFVKHPKRNKLIKLTTKTGREVIVTPDHSVFTHVNFKVAAINSDQLMVNDPVIIPSKMPCGYNDINYFNLLELLPDYRLENAEVYIRKAIKVLGWKKASDLCGVKDIYHYLLSTQKTRIPINYFVKLMNESGVEYDLGDLRIKKGTSNSIPARFPVNESILRLIGYYLSEGNIDLNKIQITNSKTKIIEDVKGICERELGLTTRTRKITGYGTSVQISIDSKPLRDLFIKIGCGRNSLYKRIPEFVYGLNKGKICALLKGMYSGDGSITSSKRAGNLIRYFSTSKKLVEDVSYALLSLGIVCRLHESNRESKNIFIAEFKKREYVEYFLKHVGFTHKKPVIIKQGFSHSKNDSVAFDSEELEKHLNLPRSYRHLRRTKCCSKDYLKELSERVKCSDELFDFAHGEFFIDKVKSIEVIKLKQPEFVYDLSVKSTQRFIGGFGGLLLHNTEALALYEAMRVGALANVVAGTIHGDTPQGIFDRLVNDLKVPATSFKATDIITIVQKLRDPSGLQESRRVTEITEVGKDWDEDPQREHAFVPLMKYNTEKDQIMATPALLEGESSVIKSIAGKVRAWAGKWDMVWDNILLRAKIKKLMLDYGLKSGNLNMLESDFIVKANDQYHRIFNDLSSETGYPDSKDVIKEFEYWIKIKAKEMVKE